MNTENLIRLSSWAKAQRPIISYSYAYKLYTLGKLPGIVIDGIIHVNKDAVKGNNKSGISGR